SGSSVGLSAAPRLGGRAPRLSRKPDWGVRRSVPVVAAPALDELEEEAMLKCLGIELQVFAVAVPVVEDAMVLEGSNPLARQVRFGFQIVVVVLRYRQKPQPVRLQARCCGEQIGGGERNVLDA